MTEPRRLQFEATKTAGPVSAIALRPRKASHLLVLAHGAGAAMEHPFMEKIAEALASHRIATFRYQFPYMESGKKPPDRPAILEETVRSAVRAAKRAVRGLPILAGGKSMGGRMTARTQADEPLPGVEGLVFLGFPLHAHGKPSDQRAEHLSSIKRPMLFLQGTRDPLAELTLMKPICRKLGRLGTLHIVDGGDHSFKVSKRSGRTDHEAIEEIAGVTATWAGRLT